MNLGFMQEMTVNKAQSDDSGTGSAFVLNTTGNTKASASAQIAQAIGLDPAPLGMKTATETKTGTTIQQDTASASQSQPITLGTVFADEVIRRLEENGATNESDGQPKDSGDLRDSLAQTMDWIRERYGDETAAAASGMILQSTSSGVNEETLGEGLLNSLKLIDRNFGIAAGDTAIANFNQGINSEINDYFDNGKAEVFYASETSAETAGSSTTQSFSSRSLARTLESSSDTDETLSVSEQLLEDLQNELDDVAALQNLTSQLEDQFNPAEFVTQSATQNAISAYTQPSVPAEPQFTNLAV